MDGQWWENVGKRLKAASKILESRLNVEILPIYGRLRITISSEPTFSGALLNAISMAVFCWLAIGAFATLSIFSRMLVALAVASTVAGIIQMGSYTETVIEFGREQLRISGTWFGIYRPSEYAVEKCSELTWREPHGEDRETLEFKYGFRTITFGSGLTVEQAQEVLAALQLHLPDVAQRMGMSYASDKSHFTRLGLN